MRGRSQLGRQRRDCLCIHSPICSLSPIYWLGGVEIGVRLGAHHQSVGICKPPSADFLDFALSFSLLAHGRLHPVLHWLRYLAMLGPSMCFMA